MKLTKKLLALLLILAMVIPAQAATGKVHESHGEPPLPQAMESTNQIRPLATPVALKHPSKSEIIAKSKTVTSSQTIFLTEPSVVAPYATGSLTEEFMQTGLTYLNYVRFVAGLPEITLDDAMNLDAQHGAVVLAAIDELTHYPSQPADMDDAFFKRGSDATSSSNISYRWGYDPLGNLKNSILGCMNDNSSIGNLTTVGHRRWLLNPTLGKVGFGYAESNSGASYIVTKVFDRSGVGCTFDFISWPAAGNQPVDLFPAQNPWSVTLNNSVYRKASADSVKITVTRESDGTQWIFDGSTGKPNTNIDPYLIVDTQGYGIPNCIIFHPGTANVRNYEGVYTVKITGIYYLNGSAAEINYTVDFFDINSYCPDHNYTPTVTAPTCTEQGYTTYTCSACGDSYISDYVSSLGHAMGSWYTTKEATCTSDGEQRRDCSRCDHFETQVITSDGHSYSKKVTAPTCTEQGYTTYTCSCGDSYVSDYVASLGHAMGNWYTTKEATCTEDGAQRRDCSRCDHFETQVITSDGHSYSKKVTAPTCTEQGYTTYTCRCGDSYVSDYVGSLGHAMGKWYTTKEATCTSDGEQRRDCSRCDHYETQVITSNGHSYSKKVTAPTCTEQGYTTYTCSSCGDSYVSDYVASLGHAMGKWYTTKEATCTEDGEQRRDCSRCDHFETQVITSDGHSYSKKVTAPTCTEQGYTTYTCHCGDNYTGDYVGSLGHDMGKWYTTKEATCTSDGEQRRDCSRCDHYETQVITSSGHHFGDDTVCDNCGFDSTSPEYPENALMLSGEEFADQDTVWINGLPYPIQGEGNDRYVELPTEDDCYMVTYTYHTGDASDIHTQYPTGMKVYKVSDGQITYIPELDNLLQYSGASIRITGKKGIRMITSLTKTNKTALTGKGLAGFKLLEYGTALCFAHEIPQGDALVLGRDFTRSNYAYKKGVADPVFASTKDLIQYTNVLVGFSLDQCKDDIAMRPYIILEDAAGNQITLYGGTIYRSIGYIAYQNRTVFKPKTASYNYVWELIHHVYGDKYDADYKG